MEEATALSHVMTDPKPRLVFMLLEGCVWLEIRRSCFTVIKRNKKIHSYYHCSFIRVYWYKYIA